MATKSIVDYIDYLKQIKTQLLDVDGVFEKLQGNIQEQFLSIWLHEHRESRDYCADECCCNSIS